MNNQARSASSLLASARRGCFPLTLAGVLSFGCGQEEDPGSNEPARAGSPSASVAGMPGAGGTSTQGGAPHVGGTSTQGASTQGGTSSPGGAAGAGSSASEGDFAAILATYSEWASATDAPVNVSSYFFTLCRAPTSAETEFAMSEHGNQRAIREWDNDLARSAIAAGRAGEFAPGAAIAKEKWVTEKGMSRLVAVGMMIRRAKGFDPSAGDWEFAYWQEQDGISRGVKQSQYCASCHAGAERGDFVFRDDYELR